MLMNNNYQGNRGFIEKNPICRLEFQRKGILYLHRQSLNVFFSVTTAQ